MEKFSKFEFFFYKLNLYIQRQVFVTIVRSISDFFQSMIHPTTNQTMKLYLCTPQGVKTSGFFWSRILDLFRDHHLPPHQSLLYHKHLYTPHGVIPQTSLEVIPQISFEITIRSELLGVHHMFHHQLITKQMASNQPTEWMNNWPANS